MHRSTFWTILYLETTVPTEVMVAMVQHAARTHLTNQLWTTHRHGDRSVPVCCGDFGAQTLPFPLTDDTILWRDANPGFVIYPPHQGLTTIVLTGDLWLQTGTLSEPTRPVPQYPYWHERLQREVALFHVCGHLSRLLATDVVILTANYKHCEGTELGFFRDGHMQASYSIFMEGWHVMGLTLIDPKALLREGLGGRFAFLHALPPLDAYAADMAPILPFYGGHLDGSETDLIDAGLLDPTRLYLPWMVPELAPQARVRSDLMAGLDTAAAAFAAQLATPPTILSPRAGQRVQPGTPLLLAVAPVSAAAAYCWQLTHAQGVTQMSTCHPTLILQPDNPAYLAMHNGSLTIMVQAQIECRWTVAQQVLIDLLPTEE